MGSPRSLGLLFNFSSDLLFSSLAQYDIQRKELGTNTILRWAYDPCDIIFVVYNYHTVRDDEEGC
ncbi:MAG: hypothetical protein O6940_05610 [Ignavibacteria bacterium]|nr:hypothetical protein [Ignavibacteria bacterium]